MKKVILIIAMLTFSISSFAQATSAYNEGRFERSKVFVKVATEEFDLTESQQKELYDKKVEHYEKSYEATQKFKQGEITKDEKKIPNKKFSKYLTKLTGKTYQELKPFYEKVSREISKL